MLSVRSDGHQLFMRLWIYGWRALRVHSPTTTCRQRFCSIMFHYVTLSSTLFCSVILASLGVWTAPPPLVNSDMIANMDLNCAYLLLLCKCNTADGTNDSDACGPCESRLSFLTRPFDTHLRVCKHTRAPGTCGALRPATGAPRGPSTTRVTASVHRGRVA